MPPVQTPSNHEDRVEDEYVLPHLDDEGNAPMEPSPLEAGILPANAVLVRTMRGGKGKRRGGQPNGLPVIQVEPHVTTIFRYSRVGTGNNYVVTIGDVAKAIVAAATSSTYRHVMRTFRIKRVTVRGTIGSVGNAATTSIRYVGQNTNEVRYMDNTLKIDENALVSRVPPKMSLASFWHDVESATLTDELFEVDYFGDGQFYVDVHLEYLLDVNRYITYTLSGGSGLAVGGIYRGELSGTTTNGLIAQGGSRL
jgi:hypothetical protein